MRSAFAVPKPQSASLRALNYSPFLEAFRKSRDGRQSVRLGELLTSMGPAYGSVFTRLDCQPSHGVELVSQSDMFAAEPAGRVIRLDSMPRPEKHRIRKWQVLIAGAGTLGETEIYGRSIIADDRLVDKYVGPHAMVLTFHQPGSIDNLYCYAFLCSPTGVSLVRTTSYGTKILSIRKDALADLRIPDANLDTKRRIASLISKTIECRETYLRQILEARAALEQLPEMAEAARMCLERKARCQIWADPLPVMSAWNLASTGGAYTYLKKQWKARLGDVLTGQGVFNGPRFARVLCKEPHGIEFYSQRDLFLIRRIPRRIVHPGFRDNLLFAPEGSLLVGGHGTLGEGEIFGRVVYVSGRLRHAGFTQDLLRISPRADAAALCYTFLSSTLGFRLLRSTGVGTKLLLMRPDLLRDLPFPEADSKTVSKVRGHLETAMTARNTADEAENEAVRIIEQEVLPSWLA